MVQKNYICDRCGKEKVGHPDITMVLRNGDEIRHVGWLKIMCKTGFVRSIDLCESCLNEFNSWYHEKEIEQIRKENEYDGLQDI